MNQTPGYINQQTFLSEEQAAYEFTMGEVRAYTGKASNMMRMLGDYYHSLLETSTQHNRLYENNIKKINEEIEVLREYGRSIFSSELEKLRLEFQSKIAQQVVAGVAQTSEPIRVFWNRLQEFMSLGKEEREKYQNDLLQYVSATKPEMVAELKQSFIDVNKIAKEMIGYVGDFTQDLMQSTDDFEQQSHELVKLYGAVVENERKRLAVPTQERTYLQEKESKEAIKTGMNALLEGTTRIKNLQADWLYHLHYAVDVSVSVKNAFKDIFNMTNIFLNMFKTTIKTQMEMIQSIDKLMASYVRGGGLLHRTSDWSGGILMEAATEARRTGGVSEERVFASAGALQSDFKEFSSLSKESMTQLTVLGAKFDQVGFSAASFAKLMNTMTTAFGMGVRETAENLEILAEKGTQMGFSIKEMMDGWAKAVEELAHYGDRAQGVFVELQKHVKETGVGLETLLSLEKKFLTFDNTADFAGKINAIAGRLVVDPVRLMMATGDEKMSIIEDALRQTNIKDPRGIMFLAQSAGLSASQVKQLMNRVEGKNIEDAGEAFDDVVKSTLEFGEKFKALLKEIAVGVGPIVVALRYIVDSLLKLNEVTEGWFIRIAFWTPTIMLSIKYAVKLWGALGKIPSLIGGISGFFDRITNSIFSFGKAAEDVSQKAKNIAENVSRVGEESKKTTESVTQLSQSANNASSGGGFAKFSSAMNSLAKGAVGILALGVAISLVALSVAFLARSFKSMEQVLGTVILFTVAIAGFVASGLLLASVAPALAKGALGILALGAAMVPLAYSMVLISKAIKGASISEYAQFAAGLVLLAGSFALSSIILGSALPFVLLAIPAWAVLIGLMISVQKIQKDIGDRAKGLSTAMDSLVDSMWSFVKGMLKIGATLFFSAGLFKIGFNSFKSAISFFVESLKKIDVQILEGLVSLLEKFKDFSSYVSGIYQLSGAIRAVGESLSELINIEDIDKMVKITSVVDSMQGASVFLGNVSNITGEHVERFTEIVNKTKVLSDSINKTKNNDTIIKILENSQKSVEAMGARLAEKEIVVKVVLDGRELGQAVAKISRESLYGTSIFNE